MNNQFEACLLACAFLTLPGCSGNASTGSSAALSPTESLTDGVTSDLATILAPRLSKRPEHLRWVPGHDGLELAAWTVVEEARVCCLIRNATDEPVSCPGGLSGVGNEDMNQVWARPAGEGPWTKISLLQYPWRFRSNTGCLMPAVLEPRSELPDKRHRFDDRKIHALPGETFSVWLPGYDFPEDWSGVVDVRIDCLVHHFPSVQLPLDAIGRQRDAWLASREAWVASRESK